MADASSGFAQSVGLLDLLDHLTTLNTMDEVERVAAAAFADLGFTEFSYHSTADGGIGGVDDHAGLQFGRPPMAWMEHYLSERLYEHDELYARGLISTTPFTWREVLKESAAGPRAVEVLNRAGEFGYRDGFVAPWRASPNMLGAVAVASDRPIERSAEFRGKLLLIAQAFAAAGVRVARGVPDNQPRLTARQRECLRWIAVGKTSWEISAILSISEHTVVEHLEEARKRLAARTSGHAAVLAISGGLIQL